MVEIPKWPWPTEQNISINCCVCFNIDNTHRVTATQIIKGFATCDAHAEHLTGEFSDFHQLVNRIRHTTPEEPF